MRRWRMTDGAVRDPFRLFGLSSANTYLFDSGENVAKGRAPVKVGKPVRMAFKVLQLMVFSDVSKGAVHRLEKLSGSRGRLCSEAIKRGRNKQHQWYYQPLVVLVDAGMAMVCYSENECLSLANGALTRSDRPSPILCMKHRLLLPKPLSAGTVMPVLCRKWATNARGISSVTVLYLWHPVGRYRSSIVELMMDMHPSRCRAKSAGLAAACQPQGVGRMYFEKAQPVSFVARNSAAIRRPVAFSFASCDIGCAEGSSLSSVRARMSVIQPKNMPTYPAYPCDAS